MIVGDLPWMSYHVDRADTVRNAAALIRAGAHCVKLEGGAKRVPMVEAIVEAEIPVMGHIGLTPQSMHAQGGFRVQGRESEAALQLVADAKALQHAGCFAIVIEGVPDAVANMITDALDIPTIGIGAECGTDGQVLVMHDLLGLEDRLAPKFVRRYGSRRRCHRRRPCLCQRRAHRSVPVGSGELPPQRDPGRSARTVRGQARSWRLNLPVGRDRSRFGRTVTPRRDSVDMSNGLDGGTAGPLHSHGPRTAPAPTAGALAQPGPQGGIQTCASMN